MRAGVKTPRRRRREETPKLSGKVRAAPPVKAGPVKAGPTGAWMSVLALMAAESRADGGAGLQLLLNHARFNERPHMSISKKREAA